jgi:hypothetical protein
VIPVFGRDDEVARWAAFNLKQVISPPYVAIGFTRDGTHWHGAAVFNEWNFSNIEITIYGPGCLSPGSIGCAYRYVFNQIKANRLTARTRRSNSLMRRLLPRLGFTYETTLKRYYGPDRKDDAFLFALFPEQAVKWM